MKKNGIALFLFFFIIICFSQETEISSDVISETLQDTLIEQNEPEISPQQEKINPLVLKNALQAEIDTISYLPDYFELPFFVFSENFHVSALYHYPLWFEKNGFLITSFDSMEKIQLYSPFYSYDYANHFVRLQSSAYHEQVSIAKTYLGMGARDMNHAFVSFRKGKIWNDITAEFSFLTFDGIWFEQNEITKMYHGNLHFPTKIGVWQISTTVIEEATTSITDKISGYDLDLTWDNSIFQFGYRRELLKNENQRNDSQFFLRKDGTYCQHYWNAKCSYVSNLKEKLYYQLQTKSDFSMLDIEHFTIWRSSEEFSTQTKLIFEKLNHFELQAHMQTFDDETVFSFFPILSAGFLWNAGKDFTQCISYETISFNEEKHHAVSAQNRMRLSFYPISIKYENYVQFIKNEIDELPAWLSKQKLVFSYSLPHDNAIQAGATHFLSGDFYNVRSEKNQVHIVNVFLQLQISNYFEINVSAMNVFSNSFEQISPYQRAHLIVGLKWIFIN